MKIIHLFLFAFILSACSTEKKNSLMELNLKGRVKFVKTFGDYPMKISGSSISKFDNKGCLIKISDHDRSYLFKTLYDFKYDDVGTLIEKRLYDDDGGLRQQWTYKFEDR